LSITSVPASPPPEPFRSHLEGLIEVLRPELQLGHVVIEATGLPGAFEHRPGELLPRPESTGHRGIDIQRDVGPDRRKGVMKPVEPLLAIRNLEEVARFPQCRHRGTSDVVSPLADDPVVLHPDLLTEPEDGRAKAGAGVTKAEATCLLISLGGDGEEGYLMQALPSLGESTREGLEGCRRQGRGRGGGHDSPHSVVLHNQRCPLRPAAIVVWPTVCPDLTPGEGRRSRKVEATRAAANRPSPTLRGSSRSSWRSIQPGLGRQRDHDDARRSMPVAAHPSATSKAGTRPARAPAIRLPTAISAAPMS